MSGYRAQANHRLYLARVLLTAWRHTAGLERTPVLTLAEAFEPAVCDHLVAAYGWFLLEITHPEPAPVVPPRGCSGLPAPGPGKVLPGEIREFERLEAEGWLGELLRERGGAVDRKQRQGNLAATAGTDPAQLEHWADQLQELFDRMSDSLEEY